MKSRLRFIHNSEIDIQRWDKVVDNSPNSRVYAKSWFLDIVNADWNGLIYGDYEYVMPLAFSRKWGVEYAYQPIFAQQHGIFPPPTPEVTSNFIGYLIERFRFIDISLNSMNLVRCGGLTITERNNYILSLKPEYEKIFDNFSISARRNVRKSIKKNDISEQVTLGEYMEFFSGINIADLKKGTINNLNNIISKSMSIGKGFLYGAYSRKNELTGAAFFLRDKDRLIYLSSVSSEEGRENLSMYFILDEVIKNFSSKPLLLDFEGSNIEGIAMFFNGFGAKPEIYQHIKLNRLPWPLKLVKK